MRIFTQKSVTSHSGRKSTSNLDAPDMPNDIRAAFIHFRGIRYYGTTKKIVPNEHAMQLYISALQTLMIVVITHVRSNNTILMI